MLPLYLLEPLPNKQHKGDWTHIDQFAISPDEATLAVCSNEVETGSSCGLANNAEYRGSGPFNGKVSLWSTETGHLLRILDHDAQPLGGMALSPDGTLLAAILGKNASDVVLWNVATGEQVRVLKSHQKPVTALCFSPDGRTLATGDETGIAKLWRIR